jgi:predicted CopG family antitoxin
MGGKTVRISEENWRRLQDLKREGESFDDVLTRLTTDDRWQGFGALAETGISDGMAEAHDRLEDELREQG